MSDKTKLSSIIKAEARMAMPEIVSIFISKYETELYDRKNNLQESIFELRKDVEILNAKVEKAGDFSKYDNVCVKRLDLVSFLNNDIKVDWEGGTIQRSVSFYHLDTKGVVDKSKGSSNFRKTFKENISIKDMKLHEKLHTEIDAASAKLSTVAAKIADMSRKERQVKARISELRLEEQGLTSLLDDQNMLQLIKID